jgi:hypothetical protein
MMKKVENEINLTENYTEGEEEIYDKYQLIMGDETIYNEGVEEELNSLNFQYIVNYQRRLQLLDCFKQAFLLHKNKWAQTTLNTLFKKTYRDKSKFSTAQLDDISKMINLMSNNIVSVTSLDNSRTYRDEKIKQNPLEAYHKVSDARDVKIVSAGMDAWNAKQTGLTYGKLTFNK